MTAPDTRETDDVSGAARAAADPEHGDEAALAHDADDGDGADPAPEPIASDEELPPPPPLVAELAAACVRFIATRYGAELDFEPDTLSFVDQWVRDARDDLERRPEAAELVQAATGAYLGEVVRRAFGGEWVVEGERADWRLCLSSVYCAFNPLGMAREALLQDEAEGWHAHFELDPGERESIEERLAALPEVSDDEFYAPSTRFDVTEIVVAALRAEMHARGLANVAFEPADYRLA